MHACLGTVPRTERRVLLLRAGGRSPERVAGIMGLSARRLARLERAGVDRLRAMARGGGCATPGHGGAAPAATPDAASLHPALATASDGTQTATLLDAGSDARRAARARLAPAGPAAGAAAAESAVPRSIFGKPFVRGAFGLDLATLLVAVALLASLCAFGRELVLTRRARGQRAREG
jgi:hypothetical protein